MTPGEILGGRYRVDALAGSGGMGSVYRAFDLERARVCAVKLVRGDKRFDAEVRALASVRHEAVVRYFDHGTHEGAPFLVMEWVEGTSLAERLRVACPPLESALALAKHLAVALVAIHAAGVVHRDLKPRNVMMPLSESWEGARIVDFGVARPTGVEGLTRSGVRLGTPRYMAPEQVLAARKVDGRADVFSLGCVLFEMVTGQRAYRGDDEVAVLARVVIEDAPRARRLRAELPAAVDDLVASLLARDARRRPAAEAAARAIEEVARLGHALPAPRTGVDDETSATHTFATADDAPLLDAIDPPPASSLPAPRAALVGREAELAALERALAEPGTVSLWGPVGVGKSRLALEVARRARARPTFWVDLHRARDLEGALHQIGLAFALPHDDDLTVAVARALATRPAPLLVLDGADVAHDELVELARGVGQSPAVTTLVVSRRRAPLDRGLELGPLPSDGPDSAASRLLVSCAEAAGVREPAAALAPLAALLEGNPLAIELAATRLVVLGARGLERRLSRPLGVLGGVRGAHEYPFTLRESLALSWDALGEGEASALAELAVFVGAFSIEDAEAVLSPRGASVVDRLQSLRERSLVSRAADESGAADVRLVLSGAVRELAGERLVASGLERRARLAHAAHAVARGEEHAERSHDPTSLRALTELLPDLLAAFDFALDADPDLALRAVLAMDPVLLARGPLVAHLRRLDAGVAAATDAALAARGRQARGRVLGLRGAVDGALGDLDAAIAAFGEGLDVERHAEALLDRGVVLKRKGDLDGAEQAFRAVLARAEHIDHARSLARARGNLGAVAHDRWRLDVAHAHYVEAVALAEAIDAPRLLGVFLGNLAVLDQERGGLAAARHRFHRALRALERVGDRRLLGITMGNLGTLELEAGRVEAALAAHERSRALLAEIGDVRSEGLAFARTGATLAMLGRADEARAAFARADHLTRSDPHSAAIARLLRAFVHRAAGDELAVEACIAEACAPSEGRAQTLEQASDEARAALRLLRAGRGNDLRSAMPAGGSGASSGG